MKGIDMVKYDPKRIVMALLFVAVLIAGRC